MQRLARLREARVVRRVHHVHQRVGLAGVLLPEGAQVARAAEVPEDQRLLVDLQPPDVESDGGRDLRGVEWVETAKDGLQLLQSSRLAGAVQAYDERVVLRFLRPRLP